MFFYDLLIFLGSWVFVLTTVSIKQTEKTIQVYREQITVFHRTSKTFVRPSELKEDDRE